MDVKSVSLRPTLQHFQQQASISQQSQHAQPNAVNNINRFMQEDSSNANANMISGQSNNTSQAAGQQAYRSRISQQPGSAMVGLPAS